MKPEIIDTLPELLERASGGPWEVYERPAGVGITGRPAASYVLPSSLTEEERMYPHDYAVARAFTSLNGFDPVAERQANAQLLALSRDMAAELLRLKQVEEGLREENDRFRTALVRISDEAPDTDPGPASASTPWGGREWISEGNYDDVAKDVRDETRWFFGQLARAALTNLQQGQDR